MCLFYLNSVGVINCIMETRITNDYKSKTKEQIKREERHNNIKNSSDTNLRRLYDAYLELTKISSDIIKKNNRSDGKVFLLQHEVTRWLAKTEKLVREIYGESSRDYDIFLNYCDNIPIGDIVSQYLVTRQMKRDYMQSIHLVHAHLEGMIDSYIQFGGTSAKANTKKLDLVLEICKNFPRAVKKLSTRHDKREPFTIKDEYDVQDLLHALLSVHFADIRDEDSCPSFAGVNSRIDFFLKKEGIGIEVKMIRETLLDNKLLPQLTADLKQYQTNPEIKLLIIFIYDPNHLLRNPQAFINDIPEMEGDMEVKVVISPL